MEDAADRSQVARLVGEVVSLARDDPQALKQRVADLSVREQAELALRLPARERLELLLHAPKPMRLVRSLPDAEFYMTVREVGPQDALPLLALGSGDQIRHLLDLESWDRERFDPDRAGAWIAMLLEAGDPTVRRFLRNAEEDTLALLIASWLRVEPITHDEGDTPPVQGPTSEAGDERGLVSPDGYYRLRPLNPEHTPAVQRFMQIFFVGEQERYQRALWSAVWELPAELEEKALHWRQSRLEERGFVGWDEAVSIYAPPSAGVARPHVPAPRDADAIGAPRAALRELNDGGALLPGIAALDGEAHERALFELTAVANRVLIADRLPSGDPEAHRAALEKAAGYVEIALRLREDRDEVASDVLREVPLLELFREGFGRVAALQERTRALVTRLGAGEPTPQTLDLIDEPVRSRLAGLLRRRPHYLELREDPAAREYREFRSRQELDETALAVRMVEVLERLFIDGLGLDLAAAAAAPGERPAPLRFSTLLLTTLGWHAARDALRCEPLPGDVVADFVRNVASRRTAAPDAATRAMERLVAGLAEAVELDARALALVHAFGRACLEQLAAECGGLDPGVPPDPRHVSCLLLAEDA